MTPFAHGAGDTPGATGPHGPHGAPTPWPTARAVAADAGHRSRNVPDGAGAGSGQAGRGGAPVRVPLADALGRIAGAPLTALTDLPPFDTSAMDGWAVTGPGPWAVREMGPGGRGLLAGHPGHAGRSGVAGGAGDTGPGELDDGQAVRIATGARIPHDATAVLRSEYGRLDDRGRLHALQGVQHGQDIRPRGQECHRGDQLLPGGVAITPAVLGLAAAAGYDTLLTAPRPRAEVLVLGDELLTEGLPRDGLIRDALGPMLPPWLRALGAEVTAVHRLGDDAHALRRHLTESDADLLVTTGGTASGPVDHVHPTLARIGAELLVDGVAVRPGHPMLLARTGEQQHLVGLPGNPLAAVSGLLTLAEPLIRALQGLGDGIGDSVGEGIGAGGDTDGTGLRPPYPTGPRPPSSVYAAVVREAVQGHPRDTRLVPVVLRSGDAQPLRYNGPAMLRGMATADALAVVPPGGAQAGQKLEILELPWATSGSGARDAWSV